MSKGYYLMCAIMFGLFCGYFLATEQWGQGFLFIVFMVLNVRWFIRELKEGEAGGNNSEN